jgi:thiamine kinase-like enzyme
LFTLFWPSAVYTFGITITINNLYLSIRMAHKPKVNEQVLNKGINELVEHDLIDSQCSQFEIKEINAGTVNHNFFVRDSRTQLLFKVFANNHALPIDRNLVFTLQTQLAIVGIAPAPLYLSGNQIYYCEQWVNNSHTLLDEKQLLEKSCLAQTAIQQLLAPLSQALYNVHNAHFGAPALDLSKHLQVYWACIESPSDKLKQEFDDMLNFCDTYMKQHKSEFVLCHNDLHIDHVSQNSDIIYDWE